MKILLKQQKLFVFGLACFLKREVPQPNKYAALFDLALSNAGTDSVVPSLRKYETRARYDGPLTEAYVKCLICSLEKWHEDMTTRVVASCVFATEGMIHEKRAKELHDCAKYVPPRRIYTPDEKAVALRIYKEQDWTPEPVGILRDALEEFGHQDEVTHILSKTHTIACPVLHNVLGRYYN